MSNSPIISIIVPVYNVELYLRKCIDSILTQTFTNFECILINDGSLDSCSAICDEYVTADSRVVVIHQKNSGVSAARNAGLDIACGEWIGFVDSDDWCDPGMFEFLHKNAIEHQADISICGLRSITDENANVKTSASKKTTEFIMNSHEALLKYFSTKYFGPFSVNKLVNKKLFSNHYEAIRYDETIFFGEDRLLFFHLIKRAQKIFYSSQAYYNCYQRCNSATRAIGAKGVTVRSLTVFDAYAKMTKMETNRKIRKRIFAYEGAIATGFYLSHIKNNPVLNDAMSSLLRRIIKKNIYYTILVGKFKEKVKACCLIFIPSVFKLYFKLIELTPRNL